MGEENAGMRLGMREVLQFKLDAWTRRDSFRSDRSLALSFCTLSGMPCWCTVRRTLKPILGPLTVLAHHQE